MNVIDRIEAEQAQHQLPQFKPGDMLRVHAKIVEHYKGRKIRGFTYKPKKASHRHYGHRQQLTSLSIEKIKLP